MAKDAPPSVTIASRVFFHQAELSPSAMSTSPSSESFVAKRMAVPTFPPFSSSSSSTQLTTLAPSLPGCLRQSSMDEGFISAAVGASAGARRSSIGEEEEGVNQREDQTSPPSSSQRESADHFRHVPTASVEAALRGGNFKCGSVLLDSLAAPIRPVHDDARRKGPRKPPPRITLCSSSPSFVSTTNSPSFVSSSRVSRVPGESGKDSDALRNIPEMGDDEDRCVSFCPDDPRLALGPHRSTGPECHLQQRQQQQQRQEHSLQHSKDKNICPTEDSGHGASRATTLHSAVPTESVVEEEEEEEVVEEVTEEKEHMTLTEDEAQVMDYFAVDEDRDTPLHVAVIEDEDAAAYIISKAKDPSQLNLHNKSWYSPIHLAAQVGNANSVRDLILGGANVTERDAKGNTALHIACAKGHYEVVLALTRPLSHEDPVITEYKPPYQRLPHNLEIYNYDGLTCFHLAALHRRKRIMGELVRCGADTDAMEARSGRTALHFAVEKHDMEVVKYLLQDCDVEVDAEAFDGSTALCLAEGRSFSGLAAFLRSYGADRDRGIAAFRKAERNGNKGKLDTDQDVSGYGSDYDSSESNLFGRF